MACGVDLGTSVLEGSDILTNWAMDISSTVDRGRGNMAGETEDVLGAINSGRGSGVKCSLVALNTKQQKDVVIFNGMITMGFFFCLLQVL
jgi:hypothetical protein